MNQGEPLPFEELEHPADVRLRVHGHDLATLFDHAAQGMFHLLRCAMPADTKPVSEHIELQAHDVETLLVDWLTELIYLAQQRRACFSDFHITHIDPTHIQATIHGVTPGGIELDIKAVTYADLHVTRDDAGQYTTTVTFDI
jgi:SHS2 domain-containing protein